MLTPQALLRLVWNNIITLIFLAVLGGAIGYAVTLRMVESYEVRAFVSFSLEAEENVVVENPTSTLADFSETFMGIVKMGEFARELSCSPRTYEKGNVLLICKVATLEQTQEAERAVRQEINTILTQYNENSSVKYSTAHLAVQSEKVVPQRKLIAVASGVGVLLLAFVLMVFVAWQRGVVWDASQIEILLGHKTLPLDRKNFERLMKEKKIALVTEHKNKSLLTLPRDLDKLKSQRVVVLLGESTVSDLAAVSESLESKAKLFTIAAKEAKLLLK